jgi:hypothetical protein
MNGVPVARQNRDRPRRAARRESSPDASTKIKTRMDAGFSGVLCGHFLCKSRNAKAVLPLFFNFQNFACLP